LQCAQVPAADLPGEHQVEEDEREGIGIRGELPSTLLAAARVRHQVPVQLQKLRQTLPHVVPIFDYQDGAAAWPRLRLGNCRFSESRIRGVRQVVCHLPV